MLYCFINYKINLKYMMHSIPNNNILNEEDSDFIITANLNKPKSSEFQYDGFWIIALKNGEVNLDSSLQQSIWKI